MDIYIGIAIGVLLVVLALSIEPLRKWLGIALVVIGLAFCLSAIGFPVGIPLLIVGGIIVYYEYHVRPRHPHHPHHLHHPARPRTARRV